MSYRSFFCLEILGSDINLQYLFQVRGHARGPVLHQRHAEGPVWLLHAIRGGPEKFTDQCAAEKVCITLRFGFEQT